MVIFNLKINKYTQKNLNRESKLYLDIQEGLALLLDKWLLLAPSGLAVRRILPDKRESSKSS